MLLLSASFYSVSAATVARSIDHARARHAHRALPASIARPFDARDGAALCGTLSLGLATIAYTGHRRRLQLLRTVGVEVARSEVCASAYRTPAPTRRVLPAEARETLHGRLRYATAAWAAFVAIAFGMMCSFPVDARWRLVGACVVMLSPARVLLRYREHEAEWALWAMALAPLTLLLGRTLWCAAPLMALALIFHGCVLAEERSA